MPKIFDPARVAAISEAAYVRRLIADSGKDAPKRMIEKDGVPPAGPTFVCKYCQRVTAIHPKLIGVDPPPTVCMICYPATEAARG